MRLIDADEFKELYKNTEGLNVATEVVLANIDDMPTVYDVDRVVEQLRKTQVYKFQGKFPDGRTCHFSDVIEIVKGGV